MMTKTGKRLFYCFAILGALAVILGAFGAHTLNPLLDTNQLGIYKTGVQYHFYHLSLLGILVSYSLYLQS